MILLRASRKTFRLGIPSFSLARVFVTKKIQAEILDNQQAAHRIDDGVYYFYKNEIIGSVLSLSRNLAW